MVNSYAHSGVYTPVCTQSLFHSISLHGSMIHTLLSGSTYRVYVHSFDASVFCQWKRGKSGIAVFTSERSLVTLRKSSQSRRRTWPPRMAPSLVSGVNGLTAGYLCAFPRFYVNSDTPLPHTYVERGDRTRSETGTTKSIKKRSGVPPSFLAQSLEKWC